MNQEIDMHLMKSLVLALSLYVPTLTAAAQAVTGETEPQFDAWLQDFVAEACAAGISADTLAALDGLTPIPRVIELDNSQPESTQTFSRYVQLRITPDQVTRGQNLLQEHREVLQAVEERYGV